MAVKEKTEKKEIKTYTGKRVSAKQYKLFLAMAPTNEARRAIKSLYLSEPAKFYSKADANSENEGVETDLPIKSKA